MFFQFRIFLTWQFLLAKKWKKNYANSKKNETTKNLSNNWDQKFEKRMILIMSKNFNLILIIPTLNT
jgi:hypothetical protein